MYLDKVYPIDRGDYLCDSSPRRERYHALKCGRKIVFFYKVLINQLLPLLILDTKSIISVMIYKVSSILFLN